MNRDSGLVTLNAVNVFFCHKLDKVNSENTVERFYTSHGSRESSISGLLSTFIYGPFMHRCR